MPIKGSVTINVDAAGNQTLDPTTGLLDRNIQNMQWSLNAPDGWKFDNPGIVFPSPPPAGYDAWPGNSPIHVSDWQIRANANHRVAHGDPVQKYKYDYKLVRPDGTVVSVDPDMENQPQP